MAYREFTYPSVQDELKLEPSQAQLYGDVAPVALEPHFARTIAEGAELAQQIDTEKARSEFMIAPILLELKRIVSKPFSVFSGVEFNVSPERKLVGYCDFLLSKSPIQMYVTAPVIALAEAKMDNPRSGLGQCIAGMVAAREFNEMKAKPVPAVYGITTSGTLWRFLELRGNALILDHAEYTIADLPRLMGILKHIVEMALAE